MEYKKVTEANKWNILIMNRESMQRQNVDDHQTTSHPQRNQTFEWTSFDLDLGYPRLPVQSHRYL